jgi:hypothetical protein
MITRESRIEYMLHHCVEKNFSFHDPAGHSYSAVSCDSSVHHGESIPQIGQGIDSTIEAFSLSTEYRRPNSMIHRR